MAIESVKSRGGSFFLGMYAYGDDDHQFLAFFLEVPQIFWPHSTQDAKQVNSEQPEQLAHPHRGDDIEILNIGGIFSRPYTD